MILRKNNCWEARCCRPWNDLYFKPEAEIITYSVTIVAPDGETNIYNVRGAELPANVQRLFKYLAEGSTIFFDDIQVKCPGDQSARNLRGVVLTLKG
ncbi:MAG: hypothetical protein IPL65_15585 [Lewinellaceae bacterium]|nr:hypothetical protein [Lewinellaceae bacterium]